MTREEAEKIVGQGMYPGNSQLTFSVGGFVALLDKLGVLKLDEPKSMHEKMWLTLFPLFEKYVTPSDVKKLLDRDGLKVGEK